MIKRTLKQVAKMAGGDLVQQEHAELMITGVSIDSRTVKPGNLFVPIVGEHFDGHEYALACAEAGAVATLWQRDHGDAPAGIPAIIVDDTLLGLQRLASVYRDQLSAHVIGITGSNGKTTTKDMVAAVLGSSYKVHKTEGNLNNHLGLPLTLLRMPEDTEYAVLEMGMSALGEIALLSRLAKPDLAVITNIGEAHLEQLGSREAIAAAKLEILAGLSEDGLLVYQGDEPLLEDRLQAIGSGEGAYGERLPARTIRFGAAPANDLYPTALMMEEEGTRFTVNGWPTEPLQIPMWGRHNVVNATAAIAIGREHNVPWERIREGLAGLKPTGMRAEITRTDDGITIVNEAYNASPTAMRAALQLLAELSGFKRKIAVIGDMLALGQEEVSFHAEIGRGLEPNEIDFVMTFGRLAASAGQEAGQNYPTGHVLMFQEKEPLIEELRRLAAPGDVILVKGSRGMKMEDIVDGFLSHRDV